ncbi:MAG: hypothetical protein JSU85_05995 [Candidatus Zixiibacteriota bacterium]|nr:MAG: hypothetical protein JSU85_05995 [candidate division Zixibacteria bacterium]
MKGKVMEEQVKETQVKKLADFSFDELKGLGSKALKKLCLAEELDADGGKDELFARLCVKRFGRGKRYIGQQTQCVICGAKVMVRNTKTDIQPDGRKLIVRSIRCKGRHQHTYPLKELV